MLDFVIALLRTNYNIIADATSSLENVGIDSLRMLEILYELEQYSGKDLQSLELSSIDTLGQLIETIEQH